MTFRTCGACGRNQAYIVALHWFDNESGGWHYLVRCRGCKRGYFTTEREAVADFPQNDPAMGQRAANLLGLIDTPGRLRVDVMTPQCCAEMARHWR